VKCTENALLGCLRSKELKVEWKGGCAERRKQKTKKVAYKDSERTKARKKCTRKLSKK
jgi:hypothetical protein